MCKDIKLMYKEVCQMPIVVFVPITLRALLTENREEGRLDLTPSPEAVTD